MNEKLRAEQARLEAAIAALATECDLAVQDGNAIRELLQHGELGVALEQLCDLLIETQADITEDQCRRVLDAAKAMGMIQREPREWKERLERLLLQVR